MIFWRWSDRAGRRNHWRLIATLVCGSSEAAAVWREVCVKNSLPPSYSIRIRSALLRLMSFGFRRLGVSAFWRFRLPSVSWRVDRRRNHCFLKTTSSPAWRANVVTFYVNIFVALGTKKPCKERFFLTVFLPSSNATFSMRCELMAKEIPKLLNTSASTLHAPRTSNSHKNKHKHSLAQPTTFVYTLFTFCGTQEIATMETTFETWKYYSPSENRIWTVGKLSSLLCRLAVKSIRNEVLNCRKWFLQRTLIRL